jgi:hypothetical protein
MDEGWLEEPVPYSAFLPCKLHKARIRMGQKLERNLER